MGAFGKLKGYIQVLIVAAVCGGLLGGGWYLFMSPIQVVIADQTSKLAKIQETVDKSLKQKATLAQFKKESEALQARLEELKMVLPQDKETDQILNSVQFSAARSNLRIQSGISRPGIDFEVYTAYPLEMEIVGTFHSLGEFLEKIRRLDRIVNIDKLRIESRASEGDNALSGSIGANYEARTYVYREEIADKAPPAKAVKVKK